MGKGYSGFYNRCVKRFLDFVVAFVLLLLFLPIYAIIAIAILLEDGWPVFYCPLRGGYHNRPFHIFKFRSMVRNADKIGGGTTAFHDPYPPSTSSITSNPKPHFSESSMLQYAIHSVQSRSLFFAIINILYLLFMGSDPGLE